MILRMWLVNSRWIWSLRAVSKFLSLGGRIRAIPNFLWHHLKNTGIYVELDNFDGNLRLSLCLDEQMQRRIFLADYYNLDIVAYLHDTLRHGMTVVDVGANIGEVTLVAANCVGPSGRVIAFEPLDEIAEQLSNNVRLNSLAHVTVEKLALAGASEQSRPIFRSHTTTVARDRNDGLGSLFNSTGCEPAEYVQVSTLDDWVASHPLDRLDRIKIDVEGAELPCINGAHETILRFRPKLIIEVQEEMSHSAGYRAADILTDLDSLDYIFSRIGRGGALSYITPHELGWFQNVLCCPWPDEHP